MHFLTEGSQQLGGDKELESFAVKYLHASLLAADTMCTKRKWKLCLFTSQNLSFHKASYQLLIKAAESRAASLIAAVFFK